MNETCEYCDDDESREGTVVYMAADGSRMRLHPSCFAEMQQGSCCGDDEAPLRAWPVASGSN